MLDCDGFRLNVGIILLNNDDQVFWARRIRDHAWQFPQGGINRGETPVQAMFRELYEETGLRPEHVHVVGRTRNWLRYEVPPSMLRKPGHFRGQKQIWFLLRLIGQETDICLHATHPAEFDAWRWSEYWTPAKVIIEFKRDVYEQALTELSRFVVRKWQTSSSISQSMC